MIGFLRCTMNNHAPRHYRVNWDGENYCGTCLRCGRPIRREARGQWRLQQSPSRVAPGERGAGHAANPRH